MVLLSLVWAGANIPYLHQPELAGCNSEGILLTGKPGGGPAIEDTPLMEVLAVVIIEDAIEA